MMAVGMMDGWVYRLLRPPQTFEKHTLHRVRSAENECTRVEGLVASNYNKQRREEIGPKSPSRVNAMPRRSIRQLL